MVDLRDSPHYDGLKLLDSKITAYQKEVSLQRIVRDDGVIPFSTLSSHVVYAGGRNVLQCAHMGALVVSIVRQCSAVLEVQHSQGKYEESLGKFVSPTQLYERKNEALRYSSLCSEFALIEADHSKWFYSYFVIPT